MKKFKIKDYLITTLIVLAIFTILFIAKKVFPFGSNTLIYGDMYDQITAFYYHFYDSVKSTSSLLIDYSTSGGVNFFGVMAYYILSPVTLILLLFPRENIFQAVSIVIAIKVLLSSLTALYSLKYLFKDKLPFLISISLALLYAFSGYTFQMFQITPWMDAVYLFPLVAVGLKKVLDCDKPYMYIIFLSLSLITSFYVSLIGVIFIFLLSIFYVLAYSKKENRKKAILGLGISTVISLLLALFIIYPSYIQIFSSSRTQFKIKSILNSKIGPLSDKLAFFFPTSLLLVTTLILFLKYKDHKQFSKFFIPNTLVLCIPYVVEPINKILHFGSYAYFPCRFGYITFFVLMVGTAYFFAKHDVKTLDYKSSKLIATVFGSALSISGAVLLYINYEKIQLAFYQLTLTKSDDVPFILLVSSLIFFVAYLSVILLLKKKTKYMQTLILLITLVQIGANVSIYMGLEHYFYHINIQYNTMQDFEETYDGTVYRVKRETEGLIMNNAMVSRYNNIDHFTSLTDATNLKVLKTLGYSSMWTKNFSKNGTMFTDVLLANKYLITKTNHDEDSEYSIITKSNGYRLYEYNYNLSYGYFTTNTSVLDKENTFKIENDIYKSISSDKEDLFTIYSDFASTNVIISDDDNGFKTYKTDEADTFSFIEQNIKVKDKKVLYLDLFYTLDNNLDSKSYRAFDIYVNDKLLIGDWPYKDNNGAYNLGTFEDEEVNIKLVLNKTVSLKNLEIGSMDYNKYIDFIKNNYIKTDVKFNENKVEVNANSSKSQLLFIPVNYIDGYTVTVNGKNSEVIKVFDNYLGVNVEEGENNIVFTYIPKGLKVGVLVSVLTLIATIILFRFKIYDKLLESKLLAKVVYYIYLLAYIIVLTSIYIVPFLCFLLSYFIYL